MIFFLKFQSLGIRNRSRREDEEFRDSEHVRGKVKFSNHREVLELKTGEVFSHSDESLEASISIGHTSNRSQEALKGVGQINYLAPIKGPDDDDEGYNGNIVFQVYLTEEYLSKLIKNIQSGLYPSEITLETFDSMEGPFEYKNFLSKHCLWDNEDKKNRRVAIEAVSFDYGIIEEVYDDELQKDISVIGKTVSEKSDPNLGELSLIRKSIDKSNTIMFAGFLILVILLMVS